VPRNPNTMLGWVPRQAADRMQPGQRASLSHQSVSEEQPAVLILPRGRSRPRPEASLTIFPRQTQQQAYPQHAERPARSRHHHQPPMYRESPLATAQQPVLTPAQEWRQQYAYSRYSGSAARTLVSPPPRMDAGHDTVLDVAIPVDLDADAETTSRMLRRAGFLRPAYLHLLSALLLFAGLDCLLLASGALPLYAAIAISLAAALALLAWCVTRPRLRADAPSESIRESIREPLESWIEIPDTEELETLPGPVSRDAVDLDGEVPEEEIAVPAAPVDLATSAGEDEDDEGDEDDEDENVRGDNIDSDNVPVEDIDLDRLATVGASTEIERCPRDLGRR
jgi:hypothetical protein